jgi:hypothetical protein
MFDKFRERRKPETDSHVLMSLENADEGVVRQILAPFGFFYCRLILRQAKDAR